MGKLTGHTITSDSALGSAVIERSLRFDANSNTRLVRTIGSTSNRRTFTYSWWSVSYTHLTLPTICSV